MSIDLTKTECLVHMDSVVAAKVVNICTGAVDWVYYPWPVMAATLTGAVILAMIIFFVIAVFVGIVASVILS